MSEEQTTAILLMLLGLSFIILLFLVMRPINLWYWKVDEQLEEKRKTNELLQKLIDKK